MGRVNYHKSKAAEMDELLYQAGHGERARELAAAQRRCDTLAQRVEQLTADVEAAQGAQQRCDQVCTALCVVCGFVCGFVRTTSTPVKGVTYTALSGCLSNHSLPRSWLRPTLIT